MSSVSLFQQWSEYVLDGDPPYQDRLSFADWLTENNQQNTTVQSIIEDILANYQDSPDLSISSLVLPPFSDPLYMLPLPHYYQLNDVTSSVDPLTPVTQYLAVKPNEWFFSAGDNRPTFIDHPYNSDYTVLPFINGDPFGQSEVTLYYLQYTPVRMVVQQPVDPIDIINPEFLPNGLFSGYCAYVNIITITLQSECDCCCCGKIDGGESSMANCQDLVNAVTLLTEKVEDLTLEVQEIKQFCVEQFLETAENSSDSLSKISDHLGQRLPHRNYTKEKNTKQFELIAKSVEALSKRLGIISLSITGKIPPSTDVDLPESISDSTDVDTEFSSSGGGGDGGDGGDGGGGGDGGDGGDGF